MERRMRRRMDQSLRPSQKLSLHHSLDNLHLLLNQGNLLLLLNLDSLLLSLESLHPNLHPHFQQTQKSIQNSTNLMKKKRLIRKRS